MVANRAQWKGFLKFGEVGCSVALYTAASTAERIAFATINQATGNRVKREFIDSETGDAVPKEAQVKGYEIDNGQHIVLTPEEVASAVPESDKQLNVTAFVECSSIDDTFFDKPYYLSPTDKISEEAFVLLREGMRKSKVAAIAQAVLFRRMRTVMIRAHGNGLIATTLNFDYEVRASATVFNEIPKMKIEGELMDLAKHIINQKKGSFDITKFDDRYEAALAEVVKAKIEGRAIPKMKAPKVSQPSDLLAALRESAGVPAKATKRVAANANPSAARKKSSRSPESTAPIAAPQKRAS